MGRRPHMGLRVDSLLKRGFRAGTCKDRLKDTVKRIKLAQKQKASSAKQLRTEIAQLLQSGQESHAYKVETENLVRIQNIMGAYDLIDHYCELVISRMQIIETQRSCPEDVKEAVASLIFAAPRCSDLQYLPHVRYMFEQKYGMEFTAAVEEVRPDCGVNTQIIELLSTSPATRQTKLQLMHEIAVENNIEWKGENEFADLPEDLPASTMESMQSRNIPPADSGDGKVSHLTEYDPPIQASQVETIWDSDSLSEIDFQDAEGSVRDSIEAAESKMGLQDAAEAAFSVIALNGESTIGTHTSNPHEDMPSSKSDEVIRMPWQEFYEDGGYSGSRRRQYKNSAIAGHAALRHEDNVPIVGTESPPLSKTQSSRSHEVPRMPWQRFCEDGASLRSARRQYGAAQAALPHEDNVPNGNGTGSPIPPEMLSSKSDEVTCVPSQEFYKHCAYRGSGTRRHYKDFASAAQVAFESAVLAAEAAQAAMDLARFFDQEPSSFKYSSSLNSLGAKAAATETPNARREFDSKLSESNVNPNIVTGEDQKTRPEMERNISDASTVYLDSLPSAVFTSARKTRERSNGETTSPSGADAGGMFNPTSDSKHVPRLRTLPANSSSGDGDLNQKLSRNSEGRDNDATIHPVSLWNRRVEGARLAKRTADTYAGRPKYDDEEDAPHAHGEHCGRNSPEKMNSGSGELLGSSTALLIGTQRGSSRHRSLSVGAVEGGGGASIRFEQRRLREDSPRAAGRGSEVFSDKPKFDDEEVKDGMGEFAGGDDRERAEAAAAPAPSLGSEAGRRSEARPRWSSSSANVADDIRYEQRKRGAYGKSRRTRWAQKRPLAAPPEAEQHDEATAASSTSRKNFTAVDEVDTKSY